MGQPRVKWGDVKRYFERRGYQIYNKGGDAFIVAPKDGTPRSRQSVLIGHHCSNHAGAELGRGYVRAIERAFGVTLNQILEG
jgi:hypothetical protein